MEMWYPLPSALRGGGVEMLGTLQNQHFVVTRGGQGCPLPARPCTRAVTSSPTSGCSVHNNPKYA